MLTYHLVEGEIKCTLIHLDGISRGETQSISFKDGGRIPDLRFSRREIFRFSLEVKKIGREKEFPYPTTEWRREGELGFFVFLTGVQRATYSGGVNFSLPAIGQEHNLQWENIAVTQYPKGRMGSIAVELHLRILA